MTEWISGQKLIENWEIQEDTLLEYVKMGLQPYYKQWYGPKPPPDVAERIKMKNAEREAWKNIISDSETPVTVQGDLEYDPITGSLSCDESTFVPTKKFNFDMEKNTIEEIENEIDELTKQCSWKDYELPLDPQEAIRVINDLLESVYATDEVEAFEKEHQISKKPRAALDASDDRPLRPEDRGEYVFWQEKKGLWFVKYGEYEDHVEHMDGMKYIAMILERAPRPFYPETIMCAKSATQEGLNNDDGDQDTDNASPSDDEPNNDDENTDNEAPDDDELSNDDKNVDVFKADNLTVKKDIDTEKTSTKEIKDIQNGISAWLKRIKGKDGDDKIHEEKKLQHYIKEAREKKSLKITINKKNGRVYVTPIASIKVTRARDNCRVLIKNAIDKMSKCVKLSGLIKHFKEDKQLSFKRSEFRYRNENIKWVVNYLD